jgi:hypothetical protein
MPGAEVVASLSSDACPARHARQTIRGVIDRHGRLTFYSPLHHGHLRIPIHDLRRAGYTIKRTESA